MNIKPLPRKELQRQETIEITCLDGYRHKSSKEETLITLTCLSEKLDIGECESKYNNSANLTYKHPSMLIIIIIFFFRGWKHNDDNSGSSCGSGDAVGNRCRRGVCHEEIEFQWKT